MKSPVALFLLLLVLVAPPASAADPTPVPLFDGLGSYARTVSTASPEAQRYFDQGLAFMYAFNHDEAIRAFTRAAELDPDCAMAHWGVAIANGPHINNTVVPPERAAAAWAALGRARAASAGASAVERALIEALASRYADPQPADRAPLERAYAEAMRGVWQAFPGDPDVGALFAESLADLRPWDLWTPDGQPQPGTEELIVTLDQVIALQPAHPLANHLYIHAVEASPEPGRADAAADRLRELQPGLGHMVHMPSHIDVRRGRWQQAIEANARAIEADRRYTARSPEQQFYRLYMAHNHHMLAYAAMMNGQSGLALETMRAMVADIPADFFRANPWADGMMAMPLEVMMRFGQWQAILAEPEFPEYAPFSRALRHYARAVALAVSDDMDGARREQAAFHAARAAVPDTTTFGNNTAVALLDVAERLMGGELLYRSGQVDAGLAMLADAVAHEDRLRYDEPPGWIQPVRHPYGAALLQAGRIAEAEAVFREDQRRQPGNGWGLYGLMRALELQGKQEEADAVERDFDRVWAKADIRIKSPCLCLPGV
jgi:tetratricopeptide (TPR) repeat protein